MHPPICSRCNNSDPNCPNCSELAQERIAMGYSHPFADFTDEPITPDPYLDEEFSPSPEFTKHD